MTVAVGLGLYGECRIAEKCICGLCAAIFRGDGERAKGRPQFEHVYRVIPECELCHKPTRKNHRCRALDPPKKPKVRKVPKPRSSVMLHGEPTEPQKCGCILWKGRRTRWCYGAHNPQTHPNPCQHAVTITQNFGTLLQKSVCTRCGNEILK